MRRVAPVKEARPVAVSGKPQVLPGGGLGVFLQIGDEVRLVFPLEFPTDAPRFLYGSLGESAALGALLSGQRKVGAFFLPVLGEPFGTLQVAGREGVEVVLDVFGVELWHVSLVLLQCVKNRAQPCPCSPPHLSTFAHILVRFVPILAH